MKHLYSTILRSWTEQLSAYWRRQLPSHLPRLLYANHLLPAFVRNCPTTMRLREQLCLLDWERLPSRLPRRWFGREPVPAAAYIGAYLVKLDQGITTMAGLRRFLVAHPALVWALGFPLHKELRSQHGFDAELSVPSQRHLSYMLSQLANDALQSLMDGQVAQLKQWLPETFGQTVAIDTKHIIAWVKENNPKAYLKEGRFHKTKQPAGDPDCKLGCKRRRNQITPASEGLPTAGLPINVGEFYWGYASGVVAAKLPSWGEFVLAEITQTFDQSDPSYFHPLMAATERRLGFRSRYAALDAAFDAFYVHEYFHSPDHDGFAAVPLRQMNLERQFDETGLPLCEAGLSMPLKSTFINRTSLVIHERGRYACPLLFPNASDKVCPIGHDKWPSGGCIITLPTSVGARLRYQLDRESDAYKAVYAQRTVAERIFSQAVNLNIERPKLRNQQAIANMNTLTYLLINLRVMQRVEEKLAQNDR
jgi:hypothetical protein